MRTTTLFVFTLLVALAAAAKVAQVHDYIMDDNCKQNYIRFSKKACVDGARCFPYGSDAVNNCESMDLWQWQDTRNPKAPNNYHPGVNPYPAQRVVATGEDKQKVVWAYTGSIRQGEAYEVYRNTGTGDQVTIDTLHHTPVNHITFIANVDVANVTHWFTPGANNTNGCGQKQTWELPFGFSGHNATESLPKFKENLQKIHEQGTTITLTMGSWCTSFPVHTSEEWTEEQFNQFVDYFKEIREDTFGGALDGIDFDWEGYCSQECLKGRCTCGWRDDFCGKFSPEELAAGQRWSAPPQKGGENITYECWIMPTKSTFQVLTGITYHMKKAGFVVTLVPMSTSMYSGKADPTAKQVLRNEYVKYRKQPYEGGTPIEGETQVDLLELADGILLQWYSGFDAALCKNGGEHIDPKSCTCDNEPDADYPNVLKVLDPEHPEKGGDGLISSYYFDNGAGGNMFPTSFPVRCQACGKNVLLPNGTYGELPCAPKGEDWFNAGNITSHPELIQEHKEKAENYTRTHDGSQPYWWVHDMEINSKCPRGIDCPDWRYKGEEPYSRQLKLLQSLADVVDLSKVSIGFETLGIDVQVQMQAWADPALPWTTVTPKQRWDQDHPIYYNKCTQNMTKENIGQEKRCAQPLLSQQWGLKFNASDVVGLMNAVTSKLGKSLAGVGFFTLDGVLAQPEGIPERFWYSELMKLNETFKIPCKTGGCGGHPVGPTPPPTPPAAKCGTWSSICPTCNGGTNNCKQCETNPAQWQCSDAVVAEE
jgi:hypothetical protein